MKTKIIIIASLIFGFACNNSVNKEPDNTSHQDTLINNQNKTLNMSEKISDTMVDNEELSTKNKVFVSISPSSKWIDSMQIISGEDGWNEVVSDNENYIYEAKEFLKERGYVEISEPKEKIWNIKLSNGITQRINTDTLTTKWGLIIFDGTNPPMYYNGTLAEIDLAGK